MNCVISPFILSSPFACLMYQSLMIRTVKLSLTTFSALKQYQVLRLGARLIVDSILFLKSRVQSHFSSYLEMPFFFALFSQKCPRQEMLSSLLRP